MSSIFATQLTAVATAVLAVFAIITAVVAGFAFKKQSDAVRDGQKVISQQAELLNVQSDQLAEQQKLNTEQIKVLELQATSLSESIAERRREAEERGSAQASQVSLAVKVTGTGRDGGPELQAIVTNASERQQPIYDVSLYWHRGPDGYGTPNPELLGTVLNSEREVRSREFPPGTDPWDSGAVLTFRDAASVDWILLADGALMEADSSYAPGLVKALGGWLPHTSRRRP